MIGLYTVGGAALLGGGIIYYLGVRKGRSEPQTVSVVPTVAPGLAGLSVAGVF